MIAFDKKLVILPFRQHASLMEMETEGQEVLLPIDGSLPDLCFFSSSGPFGEALLFA